MEIMKVVSLEILINIPSHGICTDKLYAEATTYLTTTSYNAIMGCLEGVDAIEMEFDVNNGRTVKRGPFYTQSIENLKKVLYGSR